jgi:hypothetical protein
VILFWRGGAIPEMLGGPTDKNSHPSAKPQPARCAFSASGYGIR